VLQPGPKYGAGQQLPGAPAYKGRQHVTGIMESMLLVNSGPHKRKNFSENYPQFGHNPSEISPALPCAGKVSRMFKGSQIVNVLGSSTCVVPPCGQIWNYVEFVDKPVVDFTGVYCKRLSNTGDVLSVCLPSAYLFIETLDGYQTIAATNLPVLKFLILATCSSKKRF
jgi:hypothetical protein